MIKMAGKTKVAERMDPGSDHGSNPGLDPGSDPNSDHGSNPGLDPGFILSLSPLICAENINIEGILN